MDLEEFGSYMCWNWLYSIIVMFLPPIILVGYVEWLIKKKVNINRKIILPEGSLRYKT
jgi:hypothetical protein